MNRQQNSMINKMNAAFPKVKEYSKNLRSSALYAAKTIIGVQMPGLQSTIERNSLLAKDINSVIRGDRTAAVRTSLLMDQTPIMKNIKQLGKNLKDDALSGKFYNPERSMEAMGSIMGLDWDDNNDFTTDMDNFSMDDESISNDTTTLAIRNMMATSEAGQESRTKALAQSINMTTASSAEYISSTNIGIFNNYLSSATRFHNENMNALTNLTAIGTSLLEFNNKVIVDHINNTNKYYDDSLNEMREMKELLKETTEMSRNMYKTNTGMLSQRSGVTLEDVLGMDGGFDIKSYAKIIKQNINNTTMLGTMTGVDAKFMLNQAISSPWSFMVDMMYKGLLPKATQKAMKELDNSISGLFSSMIVQMNTLARRKPGTNLGLLGKILGIDFMVNRKPDLSLFRKQGVTVDVQTKQAKAITEVIPAYLSKLVAIASGTGKEMIYDYNTGKFVDRAIKKKEYTERLNNIHGNKMDDTKEALLKNISAFDIKDEKLRKNVSKDVDEFMRYLINGDFYNPIKENDYNILHAKGLNLSNPMIYNLIRAGMLEFTPSQMNSVYKNVIASVKNAQRNKRFIQEELQDNGMSAAINEFDLDYKKHRFRNSKSQLKSSKGGKIKNKKLVNDDIKDLVHMSNATDINDINDLSDIGFLRKQIKNTKEVRDAEFEKRKREEEAKKQTDFQKFISENSVRKRFDILKGKVQRAIKSPWDLVTQAAEMLDRGIYKILYGTEQEDGSHLSLLDELKESVLNIKDKVVKYLDKEILIPIHEKLFGENGWFTEGTNGWTKELKGFLPKGIVGALGGAGASLILPGGPLIGAFLGSGIAFAQHSERFQDYLFGKFGDPDENGVRTRDNTGLIPTEFQQAYKKYVPSMFKGAGAGVIGGALLASSPVIGGFLGASIGFAKRSETIKNYLFGTFDPETKTRLTDGLLSKDQQEFIKKYYPKGITGGTLGVIGSFFLPGGPLVGAMIGAGMGIASQTDKFKNWMWGTADDKGKRHGGVAGQVRDFMKEEIFDPFKAWRKKTKENIGDWFKESIAKPFEAAKEPVKKAFNIMSEQMKEAWSKTMGELKDMMNGIFERNIGMPFKEFIKEKITDPLKGILKKIFGALGKVVGSILSAPIKGITAIANSIIKSHDENESKKEKSNKKLSLSDRLKQFAENIQGKAIKTNQFLLENGMISSPVERLIEEDKQGTSFWGKVKNKAKGAYNKLQIKAMQANQYLLENGFISSPLGQVPSTTIPQQNITSQDAAKVIKLEAKKKAATILPESLVAADIIELHSNNESKKTRKNPNDDFTGDASETTTPSNNKKDTDQGPSDKKKSKKDSPLFKSIKKIESHSKFIKDEIKGQLNGVGWNIEYIKNILKDAFGAPSEMPNGDRRGGTNKRRKGFLGKILDFITMPFKKVGGILGSVFDKFMESKPGHFLGKVGNGILSVAKLPFKLASETWTTLKGLGSFGLELVKFVGTSLTETIKTAGTAIRAAFNGIVDVVKGAGKALGEGIAGLGTALKNTLEGITEFGKVAFPIIGGGILTFGKYLFGKAWKLGGVLKNFALSPFKFVAKKLGLIDPGLGKRERKITIDGGTIDLVRVVDKVNNVGGKKSNNKGPKNGSSPKNKINHPEVAMDIDDNNNKKSWFSFGRRFNDLKDATKIDWQKNMTKLKESLKNIRNPFDFRSRQLDLQYAQTAAVVDLASHMSGSGENKSNSMKDILSKMIKYLNPLALGLAWFKNLADGDGAGFVKNITRSKIGQKILDPIIRNFLKKKFPKLFSEISKETTEQVAKDVGEEAIEAGVKASTKQGFATTIKKAGSRLITPAKNAIKERILKSESKFGMEMAEIISRPGTSFTKKAIARIGERALTSENKLVKIIVSIIKHPKVVKVLGNVKVVNKFASKIAKQITERIAKAGSSAVGKAITRWSPTAIAFILYDLTSGMADARNIFRVPPTTNITWGMRATAGLAKALSGFFSFGFVPFGWLANIIFGFFGNAEDNERLKAEQAQMKKDYENFITENPDKSDMTFADYNDMQNQTVWDKTKTAAKNFGKGVVNVTKTGIKYGAEGIKRGFKLSTALSTGGLQPFIAGAINADKIFGPNSSLQQKISSGLGSVANAFTLGFADTNKTSTSINNILTNVHTKMSDTLGFIKDNIFPVIGGLFEFFTDPIGFAKRKTMAFIMNKISKKSSSNNKTQTEQKKTTNSVSVKKSPSIKDTKLPLVPIPGQLGLQLGLPYRKNGGGNSDYQYYSQNDPRWKNTEYGTFGNKPDTIGKGGCGPAVAAMAISKLTGKQVTPPEIAKFALNSGYKLKNDGTKPEFVPALGKKYGIDFTKIKYNDKETMGTTLKSGLPVILMGKNGPYGKSPHYLLATGISGTGNVEILDPENKNNKTAKLRDLLLYSKSMYSGKKARSDKEYAEAVMKAYGIRIAPNKNTKTPTKPSTTKSKSVQSSATTQPESTTNTNQQEVLRPGLHQAMTALSSIGTSATDLVNKTYFSNNGSMDMLMGKFSAALTGEEYSTANADGTVTDKESGYKGVNIDYDVPDSDLAYRAVKTAETLSFKTSSARQFVEKIKPYAIESYKRFGILPSLIIAQAALESTWGKDSIGNAVFGVKLGDNPKTNEFWKGKKRLCWTKEWVNGRYIRMKAWFRDYATVRDSVMDHGRMLGTWSNYAPVKRARNYVEACIAVKKCKYATSPTYTQSLINLIETHGLQSIDDEAKGLKTSKGRGNNISNNTVLQSAINSCQSNPTSCNNPLGRGTINKFKNASNNIKSIMPSVGRGVAKIVKQPITKKVSLPSPKKAVESISSTIIRKNASSIKQSSFISTDKSSDAIIKLLTRIADSLDSIKATNASIAQSSAITAEKSGPNTTVLAAQTAPTGRNSLIGYGEKNTGSPKYDLIDSITTGSKY